MPDVTDTTPDYFTLLGLSPAFGLDAEALDRAWHERQRQVHPDRFAGAAASEQHQAAQQAALANEAYRILKQPVQRARHLVQMRGIDLSRCALPEDFLFTQLELREAVQRAAVNRDGRALTDLQLDLRKEYAALHERLARQIDAERDYAHAARTVLILQYYDRLLADIEDALFEAGT